MMRTGPGRGTAAWTRRLRAPVLGGIAVAALAAPAAAQQQEPPPVSAEEQEFILRTLRVRDSLRAIPDSLRVDTTRAGARRDVRGRGGRATGRSQAGRRGRGAGGEAAPTDSVAALLSRLGGFHVTTYSSDSARFGMRDRRLHLFADSAVRAEVRRDGNVLTADSLIIYQEGRSRVEVYGSPTFTPPQGDAVNSVQMYYDLAESRGTAFDARTQVQTQATWYIQGDLPSVSRNTVYGRHSNFTTCELEVPHYHFRSSDVKIVNDEILVARPVTLYFADVPVMWLPFMAQSIKQGRRSGILTPRFSVNDVVRTSSSFQRRVSNIGFYWAMNQYMDSQLAFDWFSGRFFALTGNFRYHFLRKFLRGDINYRQFWEDGGGRELAFDTRHSWQISERTDLRVSARFASSSDFVRQNSFDPREITQSINSDAGFNHRFDWGSVSISGNRKQFLNDDRTEMTLPSLNLSLNPITFFPAPRNRAGAFNNITWSGGTSFNANHFDRPEQPDTAFSESAADGRDLRAGLNSSFTLGKFSWAQSANLNQEEIFEVPDSAGDRRDLSEATVDWSTSLDYQQRLIGSTTLTPSLRISGSLFRSDREPRAESFVSAPARMSVGAGLKSDIYGFFGAIGPFSAIRHKFSPSFDWSWSPEVVPTELQREVFGSRGSQARNELRIGLNQTFEAKRKSDEDDEEGEAAADTAAADTAAVEEGERAGAVRSEEPRRREREAKAITLLSIQTSAVTYDFVQADSLGEFIDGFTTTRLRNQFRSDFLRGLSISMEHDLFEREEETQKRTFSPRLSQLNLSFSLSSSSGIFQALGFGGASDEEARDETAREAGAGEAGVLPEDEVDESSVLPVRSIGPRARSGRGGRSGGAGGVGGWRANMSYSLQRTSDDEPADQMLQWTLNFKPTEQWDVNWRSSYDIAAGRFNDHVLSLTRDLHRWEASFDFLQTATGNWSFRFRVALTDNRDLKFDYDQRSGADEGALRDRRRGRRR